MRDREIYPFWLIIFIPTGQYLMTDFIPTRIKFTVRELREYLSHFPLDQEWELVHYKDASELGPEYGAWTNMKQNANWDLECPWIYTESERFPTPPPKLMTDSEIFKEHIFNAVERESDVQTSNSDEKRPEDAPG